jgi:hypothetical protein
MSSVPEACERARAPKDQAQWYDEWLTLFASRNEVADAYADLLSAYGADWRGWSPINEAILRRWSPYGLRYIKEKAWKIVALAGPPVQEPA